MSYSEWWIPYSLSGRDGEHLALSSFPTMDIELMFRSRGHVFVWSSTSLLQSDSKWTRMVRALLYDYFCVRHAFMPFSSGLASMQNRASTFWLLWEFLWHVFCIFCNRFVYLALLYPLGPAIMNRCSKPSAVYSTIDYSKLHETASAAYRCASC